MPEQSFNIKSTIVRSGKAEFLKVGYEKASLRTICGNAGVTTGAFYSHFRSKNQLFDLIVRDELGDYQALVSTFDLQSPVTVQAFVDAGANFLGTALEHREVVQLLLNRAQGSSYGDCRQQLEERIRTASHRMLEDAGRPDDVMADIIASATVLCLGDAIDKETDADRRPVAVANLKAFISGGLTALLA